MIGKKLILGIFTIADIALIAIYYTLAAILLVAVLQNSVRPLINLDNKSVQDMSNVRLVSHVCLEAAIIGILAFLIRKIVISLPTPLYNVKGYKKFHTQEVSGGFLIGFLVIRGGLVDDFKDKLGEIIKRLNRKIYN